MTFSRSLSTKSFALTVGAAKHEKLLPAKRSTLVFTPIALNKTPAALRG
jgi:hypothetical protein